MLSHLKHQIKVCVNYNQDLKYENIICDISILNWVDKYVFYYFIDKLNNKNSNEIKNNIDNDFDDINNYLCNLFQ